VQDKVGRRYAAAALSVREGGASSCFGSEARRVLDPEAPGVDWTGESYADFG
jgi:hypothetical protein